MARFTVTVALQLQVAVEFRQASGPLHPSHRRYLPLFSPAAGDRDHWAMMMVRVRVRLGLDSEVSHGQQRHAATFEFIYTFMKNIVKSQMSSGYPDSIRPAPALAAQLKPGPATVTVAARFGTLKNTDMSSHDPASAIKTPPA